MDHMFATGQAFHCLGSFCIDALLCRVVRRLWFLITKKKNVGKVRPRSFNNIDLFCSVAGKVVLQFLGKFTAISFFLLFLQALRHPFPISQSYVMQEWSFIRPTTRQRRTHKYMGTTAAVARQPDDTWTRLSHSSPLLVIFLESFLSIGIFWTHFTHVRKKDVGKKSLYRRRRWHTYTLCNRLLPLLHYFGGKSGRKPIFSKGRHHFYCTFSSSAISRV